ncbi:MAG: protein phosphatase 2C domain-containing protein [Acetobacteraceae bacterium]|nr:protein phosphatase 2C domain-containing protein [Acetobacteraceae bacterium]
MRLEAATTSRDPAHAEANEDAIVILPGRAYAVIDGVSDRTGARYDGELSGRHAARLVAGTLERLLPGPPPPAESIVPTLTATLHEAYLRHATLAAAQADWGARLCCTLALALHDGPRLHLVLVGDSGIRLNGREVLQATKDLDRITATLRSHAWHAVADPDPMLRDRIARQVAWHGTAQHPAPHGLDLAAIAAAAEAECIAALPHVPRADIAHLLSRGIVGAQGDYQNNPHSILGYGCLDGFAVPRTLLRIATLDTRTVETLELFTDGYFRPGATPGLAAWEQAHAEVEAEDPAKVGRWRSTKGSTPQRWADDRSYILVAP